MQGIDELEFVRGIAAHLTYLHQYLQKYTQQDKKDSLDDSIQANPNFQVDSLLSDDLNNLNSQITECKKQKLLKEHQLSNKPKKPISSFVFYFREQIKRRDHPSNEKQVGKLAKIISQEWKLLPLDVKEPYYQKAQQSKRVYKQNMKSYNSEHAEEIEQIQKLKRMTNNKLRRLKRRKQSKDNDSFPKKLKYKKKKPKKAVDDNGIPKPKIPLSSFFIFFQENGPRISLEHQQNRRSRLVQIASEQWKQMNRQDKVKYQNISKQNKEIYERQLEQYTIRSSLIAKQKPSQMVCESKPEPNVVHEVDSLGQPSETSSSSSICNLQLSSSDSYVEQQTTTKPQPVIIQPQPQEPPQIKKEVIVKPKKKSKRGKRGKQSHRPKGPVSSFFLYYNCVVRQLKKEFPDLKGSQLVKIASQRWALFSEEEKQIYQEQAKRGRELYDIQMEQFQKEYPQQAAQMKYFKSKRDK